MHHKRESEQEEDELEALLDSFCNQAEAETKKSQARHAKAASKGHAPSASARLATGLAQPLPQNNKGFKMMHSMGYQPGHGLGVQGQGPTAPPELSIRGKRSGLGVDEAKREQEARKQQEAEARQAKRARQEASRTAAFTNATRAGFAARQMFQHLHQAWSSAEQLIENVHQQQQQHVENTQQQQQQQQRWRRQHQDLSQLHQEGQHQQQQSRPLNHGLGGLPLQLTALYPRLLAGSFISEDDVLQALTQTGKSRSQKLLADVQGTLQAETEATATQSQACAIASAIAEEAKADPDMLALQLQLLLSFLRMQHAYCLWCGAQYDSVEQLQEACPGKHEDDH